MRLLVVVGVATLAVACGRRDEGGGASQDGGSAMDRPHVVFTSPALTIDRLESPVRAPVTVPSRPSPETLESDDPRVVSIDEQGRLVAHARGSTVVRATTGGRGALTVDVVVPTLLRAEPRQVTLAPGGSAAVLVRDESGREVPGAALVWDTSAPNAVVVSRGRVHAFSSLGQFELTARVGEASVVLPVLVSDGAERLVVTPARARMRRTEVALFRVSSGSGPLTAEWRSDRPRTLSAVGQGIFQALQSGAARACARVGAREVCADVEVTP